MHIHTNKNKHTQTFSDFSQKFSQCRNVPTLGVALYMYIYTLLKV